MLPQLHDMIYVTAIHFSYEAFRKSCSYKWAVHDVVATKPSTQRKRLDREKCTFFKLARFKQLI